MILWLLPKTQRFPSMHRFTLTQRLLDAAFDTLEGLSDARFRSGRARSDRLRAADAALARVRTHLYLAHQLKWLNDGSYEHVSRMVSDVGRLIGGWRRATDPG